MSELSPRELAVKLLDCSPCKVQMAAVIWDDQGIISVGWCRGNGNGSGIHAEQDAIERADPVRLIGARITIVGRRKKSKNWVFSRPCDGKKPYRRGYTMPCLELLQSKGISTIEYINKAGNFEEMRLQFVRVKNDPHFTLSFISLAENHALQGREAVIYKILEF
jgi:pyrimidine deaminase RibD-like protein